MKIVAVVVLLAASLLADVFLWHRVTSLEQARTEAAKSFPLGEEMGYMQRYADKLWYAGTAGNWELAGFYRGEIAETAEAIADARVVDDGVPVSQLLQTMLPPTLDQMQQAVVARDPAVFRQRYEQMVSTCNACHQQAKHGFIHVAVPVGPPGQWNQSFAPP